MINWPEFDLHHYSSVLQQTNNWYFLFDGRLETQVCNEPYNLTLICSWNLPLKKARKNWPLHRWHYHRFSLYIHYTPLCEQTHQEVIFKRCTKSFAPFKNCSPMSFLVTMPRVYINWEDLLKVNIMTASKIKPLYQTCQAAFYSASALKDCIIFFCPILKPKDKPLTEQSQPKQEQNKWTLSSYFSALEYLWSFLWSEVT